MSESDVLQLHIDTTAGQVARASADALTVGDGRTIDVRLVSWGEVANTPQGRETFLPGAFAGVDPSRVMLESLARGRLGGDGTEHPGAIIVGAATAVEERADGAYASFRVARTAAGDELLTLATDRVLRDASVVFRPRRNGSRMRADGITERTAVDLFRVGIVERGAYGTAQVLAVRSAATEETTVEEGNAAAAVAVPAFDPAPILARMASHDDALAGMEERMTRAIAAAGVPARGGDNPLSAFGSLGEYARAAFAGPSARESRNPGDQILARTIADQILSQNDGMAAPAWLSDVKRIVDLGRRAITAFGGGKPLPEKGMTVTWPFLTSSNTLIASQSTQKAEIQSQRVDIDDASGTIVTYAGGSDIALQLLERGTPSYLDAYERIMLAEWGKITDAAFATALEGASGTTTMVARGILGTDMALTTSAASDDIIDTTPDHGFVAGDAVVFTALTGGTGLTAGRVYWVVPTSLGAKTFRVAATPGGTVLGFSADITAGTAAKITDTGAKFRAALFDASVAIEDATGAPASVALAGTDAFLAIAGMSGIVDPLPAGNPSNASGTALASTLTMQSSGLLIVRTPGISAGKVVVSNRNAAEWLEDGPKWLTAADVFHLGRDVAVYSYGVGAVYVPAGVVEMTFI